MTICCTYILLLVLGSQLLVHPLAGMELLEAVGHMLAADILVRLLPLLAVILLHSASVNCQYTRHAGMSMAVADDCCLTSVFRPALSLQQQG